MTDDDIFLSKRSRCIKTHLKHVRNIAIYDNDIYDNDIGDFSYRV